MSHNYSDRFKPGLIISKNYFKKYCCCNIVQENVAEKKVFLTTMNFVIIGGKI